MPGYYDTSLSALRLKKCYDIAPSRIRQYLQAEIDFVLKKISRKDVVLDLGCGYGRLIPQLAKKAKFVQGIDTSIPSLLFGKEYLRNTQHYCLQHMNAAKLAFSANTMDVVLCLQNGISAFHVDQRTLIKEAVRVTKPGGAAIFSTYSEKFWEHRLKWFALQSKAGLIGELDTEKTRNGNIVCKDGFSATTISPKKFLDLTRWIRNIKVMVREVDDSCLFFVIKKLI
ncbi:MAG: class I SAM-dependent methyltransferase [Bacteroidetes bacterium]|nr:class I SAM-dependent methyltransferase [Bacteroidota bacterium]